MTQIRSMGEKDVPAAARLLGQSWRRTYGPILGEETAIRISGEYHAPDRLVTELADTNIMSFVAERRDGAIVGYAMAELRDRDLMLHRLHIDKSEFGSGLAADLLHAVLAAHAGLPSIALEVLEGNDRALSFYRKHGFEVVDRKAAAHGMDGHFSLLMRRLLPRA